MLAILTLINHPNGPGFPCHEDCLTFPRRAPSTKYVKLSSSFFQVSSRIPALSMNGFTIIQVWNLAVSTQMQSICGYHTCNTPKTPSRRPPLPQLKTQRNTVNPFLLSTLTFPKKWFHPLSPILREHICTSSSPF